MANLAAHGDSNGNNAAVGKEIGSLEALVQLTCSSHEGVRYVEVSVSHVYKASSCCLFFLSFQCCILGGFVYSCSRFSLS